MIPMLVSGIALLVVLYVTFEPITVTAANQDTALESAIAQFGTLEAVKAISFVATTAWSAIIWRYGLEHQRGISPGGAWGVSGGVAVLTMVATIV